MCVTIASPTPVQASENNHIMICSYIILNDSEQCPAASEGDREHVLLGLFEFFPPVAIGDLHKWRPLIRYSSPVMLPECKVNRITRDLCVKDGVRRAVSQVYKPCLFYPAG